MATTKDPSTPLDRVARDLSRTLLHGSRPTDTAGNVHPSAVATGQQIAIANSPNGPMNFQFNAHNAPAPLTVPVSAQMAADYENFVRDALGGNASTYMKLNVDREIPTWVFQQRQFTVANPPAPDDIIPAPPLSVVKLPSAVLQEVQLSETDSFVSLYAMDQTSKTLLPIPRANWQPAIVIKFPVTKTASDPADGSHAYELSGARQGDRWYLDQLGLLPGRPAPAKLPTIQAIALTLQGKDATSRSAVLTQWAIGRTNLTREARATAPAMLAEAAQPKAVPLESYPYIALSSDATPGREANVVALLEMASITNSGGYFVATPTDFPGAQTLILTVLLAPEGDTNTAAVESAWLPFAANAAALSPSAAGVLPTPDAVRFNGAAQIAVTPYTPPGTVSFGWTRNVPDPPVSLEDKFGYGTLSIVDYSAVDGANRPVPLQDAIPTISPMDRLPGDHFEELQPPEASESAVPAKSSAMRFRPRHQAPEAAAPAVAGPTLTHYYRATLACYDKSVKPAEPWKRLMDANARQITLTPGFRDVFGNRFDIPSSVGSPVPATTRRLFYTDAVIPVSEWPGVRFALFAGAAGSATLTLEMSYDPSGANDNNKARLLDICTQLKGVDNDVTVTLSADLLDRKGDLASRLTGPVNLTVETITDALTTWAKGTATAPVPLATVVCSGSLTKVFRLVPQITITRTNQDYLPLAADFPADPTLHATIKAQVTTATAAIDMQSAATPPAPNGQQDEFKGVAEAFQKAIGAPLDLRVGFLRDQANVHELWLVPNSLFPRVAANSSAWSFATPCPLSNALGNESFSVPDFTKTAAAGAAAWQTFPLMSVQMADVDYDQLGRVALALLENETADVTTLMTPANADTMRSLLATREAIANQLSTYQGSGFLVPLFADGAGGLDGNAITRTAKDAFLSDLRAFYAVSTILQLPLDSRGDSEIQTFEGIVSAVKWVGGVAPNPTPTFSGVLLGGGEPKVTILYDVPAGAGTIPAIQELDIAIAFVQLPLVGASKNDFNEGPWIELATSFPLTWNGYPESVPVADRTFPTKPILEKLEALSPFENLVTGEIDAPVPITAADAALLARWGWRLSAALPGGRSTDTLHVTVNYPQPVQTVAKSSLAAPDTWKPVSLLNCLLALRLLNDNWDTTLVKQQQLSLLDQLAKFLTAEFLPKGPQSNQAPIGPAAGAVADVFKIRDGVNAVEKVSAQVMGGPITAVWTSAHGIDSATIVAQAEAAGNNAILTGAARGCNVALTLKRNETFGQNPPNVHDGNPLLVYQCAPVQSGADCKPFNRWTSVQFDMTGQTLSSALTAFFTGLLQGADRSNLSIEVGVALAWTKGSLNAVTPFALFPGDGSTGATPGDLSTAVFTVCQNLMGMSGAESPVVPPDVDAASVRLHVKVTLPDPATPTEKRLVVEVAGIDFQLSKPAATFEEDIVPTTNGFDVSHHQGPIDWTSVPAGAMSFCIVKASDGGTNTDAQFGTNWAGAKSAGLIRGAYHFFRPGTAVADQVANFTAQLGTSLELQDLPPALDLEIPTDDPTAWDGITPAQAVAMATDWLTRVQALTQRAPMVYLNSNFVNTVLGGDPGGLAGFALWYARYIQAEDPGVPNGWTKWTFWQFTDQGSVAGVDGNVDLDRFAGSLDDLKTFIAASIVIPQASRGAALSGEGDAWNQVSALAQNALTFWNGFIGLQSGVNPLDATGTARLLTIIRAVSWVESAHGTGLGASASVDPMQCGNPADAWWGELIDCSSAQDRFVGGVGKPNYNACELPDKAAADATFPATAYLSSLGDKTKGHSDGNFNQTMSYNWGIPFLIHKINTTAGDNTYQCGALDRPRLVAGAVAYNGGGVTDYETRINQALDLIGGLGPASQSEVFSAASPQKIIDFCEANYPDNKDDCNKFVKAVAKDLAVLTFQAGDNADAIVQRMRDASDWTQLTGGPDAKAKADAGLFVIAGLKAADHTPPRLHGHVAVVVSGPIARDKYPSAYWGSLGGTPGRNQTLNWAWNADDRDNVEYYSKPLSGLPAPMLTTVRPDSAAYDIALSVVEELIAQLEKPEDPTKPSRVFRNGVELIEISVQIGATKIDLKVSGPRPPL